MSSGSAAVSVTSNDSAAVSVTSNDSAAVSTVTSSDSAKPDEPVSAVASKGSAKPDEPKRKIILKAADGEDFEVDEAVAMEFRTVKSYFEDNSDEHDPVVPLPLLKGRILAKIVEYSTKHVEFRDEKASESAVKSYDTDFVKEVSNEGLKELILAANYVDHKRLLDFLNQTCADRIKNKSVKYVREFFGIENDFTPEEEAAIRSQNAWAFEGVEDD